MKFVTTHKKEIAEWLRSGEQIHVGRMEMNESVGKVVGRAKDSAAVETNKATIILLRDDSPQGYHILTSFPSR